MENEIETVVVVTNKDNERNVYFATKHRVVYLRVWVSVIRDATVADVAAANAAAVVAVGKL